MKDIKIYAPKIKIHNKIQLTFFYFVKVAGWDKEDLKCITD